MFWAYNYIIFPGTCGIWPCWLIHFLQFIKCYLHLLVTQTMISRVGLLLGVNDTGHTASHTCCFYCFPHSLDLFSPTVLDQLCPLHQVRAKTIMEICWTLQVGFSKSAFYGDKIILSVVCIFNQSSLIASCEEHMSRTSHCCVCISHWLFWHCNGFNAWINLNGTWLSMATHRCSLRFFLSRREAVTQASFQALNIVKV